MIHNDLSQSTYIEKNALAAQVRQYRESDTEILYYFNTFIKATPLYTQQENRTKENLKALHKMLLLSTNDLHSLSCFGCRFNGI